MHVKTLSPATRKTNHEEYSTFLRRHGLKYKEVDSSYYQVGNIKGTQGWILHISVIRPQIPQLLNTLIPELVKDKVAFKVVRDETNASLLLGGSLGYECVGKIVTIYSDCDEKVLQLARKLIRLTEVFRGPAVPTDSHLGGTVYTRYGAFKPEVKYDETGRSEKYIYDFKGQLIKDIQPIPFQMPKYVKWPFNSIAPLTSFRSNKVLNNTYLILSTIKADAKGNVLNALEIKGLKIKRCVIKVGNHDMCADDMGRDIQDRLQWQNTLQMKFGAKIRMPKVLSIFKKNWNTYLVVEYIKGTKLTDAVDKIYNKECWQQLERSKKILLLEYLLEILGAIEKLHVEGHIHRDITPGNFIINKKDELVMIDMELVYSLVDGLPSPPFNLGTPGFMSAEQWESRTPTIKEDVFSLGALMIFLFTNLHPIKFGNKASHLVHVLNFFIEKNGMSQMITQCMQHDPKLRPSITTIKEIVEEFRTELEMPQKSYKPIRCNEIDLSLVRHVILDGLTALHSPIMAKPGKPWHSSVTTQKTVSNRQLNYTYSMGFYGGISGILYLLSAAKRINILNSKLTSAYALNFKYLAKNFLSEISKAPPGLFFGTSGVSLSIASGLESDLIDPSIEIKAIINQCLKLPNSRLNLAHGIAGQGLAALHCMPHLKYEFAKMLLDQYVERLLNSQRKDGCWIENGERRTDLSAGVAGIVLFLIEYYNHFQDVSIQHAIEKALQWLYKKAQKTKGKFNWLISNKMKRASPWFGEGLTGIALCFIYAYEIFNDVLYKKVAEGSLYNHPRLLVCDQFNIVEGLSGIGEVYLEAFRVLKSEEWFERSKWLVNLLIHGNTLQDDGSLYWVVENSQLPTADFMSGNSGVIHFLMRFVMPDELNFPLLKTNS